MRKHDLTKKGETLRKSPPRSPVRRGSEHSNMDLEKRLARQDSFLAKGLQDMKEILSRQLTQPREQPMMFQPPVFMSQPQMMMQQENPLLGPKPVSQSMSQPPIMTQQGIPLPGFHQMSQTTFRGNQ